MTKFPCIFPRNRELGGGDEFADDCLHRQLVYCFYGDNLLSEIIARGLLSGVIQIDPLAGASDFFAAADLK